MKNSSTNKFFILMTLLSGILALPVASEPLNHRAVPALYRPLITSEYWQTLPEFIDKAKTKITIAMYLLESQSSAPERALAALDRAIRRGVRVTIYLDTSLKTKKGRPRNAAAGTWFQKRKAKVRYFRGGRAGHLKMVVIDGRYSFVGSANWTTMAFLVNDEVTILVDSKKIARQCLNYLSSLQTYSQASGPWESRIKSKTQKKPVLSINVNWAKAKDLEALPGIGPKLAKKIIEFRKENGDFRAKEDLLQIPGIDPERMKKIEKWIRF